MGCMCLRQLSSTVAERRGPVSVSGDVSGSIRPVSVMSCARGSGCATFVNKAAQSDMEERICRHSARKLQKPTIDCTLTRVHFTATHHQTASLFLPSSQEYGPHVSTKYPHCHDLSSNASWGLGLFSPAARSPHVRFIEVRSMTTPSTVVHPRLRRPVRWSRWMRLGAFFLVFCAFQLALFNSYTSASTLSRLSAFSYRSTVCWYVLPRPRAPRASQERNAIRLIGQLPIRECVLLLVQVSPTPQYLLARMPRHQVAFTVRCNPQPE